MNKPCKIDGCPREARYKAIEMCNTHYEQLRRKGSIRPVRASRPSGISDDEWFDCRVAPDGDCMVWQGGVNANGYGVFYLPGYRATAHRWAYERRYGSIPEGMIIDHQCGNRTCVNPDHLAAVTYKGNAENRTVRSDSSTGVRGVQPSHRSKAWVARVTHNRKPIHIGHFDTIEEAQAAVVTARQRYFTNSVSDIIGR